MKSCASAPRRVSIIIIIIIITIIIIVINVTTTTTTTTTTTFGLGLTSLFFRSYSRLSLGLQGRTFKPDDLPVTPPTVSKD